MARFSGTVWAPLPEAGAPDGHVKTQFIVHSTGDNGTAAATARYFGGSTPNESTLIIGWGPERNDPTLQIMDSTDRADANMSASVRAISVEVVGDGIGGYTPWQRSELIRIGIEARQLHPGILPRVIPSEPAAGYGWHVMFGAPGPWAAVAKSCPGKQRIQELKTDIFPAIFTNQQEDDVSYAQWPKEDRDKLLMEVREQVKLELDGRPAASGSSYTDWPIEARNFFLEDVRDSILSPALAGQAAGFAEALRTASAGRPVDLAAVKAAAKAGAEQALAEGVDVNVNVGGREA